MNQNIEFMRYIEEQFQAESEFKNRSLYKIFYGQIFPAPILTLGLNPGGNSKETSEDGTSQNDGSPASSSSSYFEEMENDVLDCDWPENVGLRRLLLPLVGNDTGRFRREIVKTNIIFRRSSRLKEIDRVAAERESAPFVDKIIAYVKPRLIVLTGPDIQSFVTTHTRSSYFITETIREPQINHVVFAAKAARLRASDHDAIIVQVAHASQFSWTYERYSVSARILEIMTQLSKLDVYATQKPPQLLRNYTKNSRDASASELKKTPKARTNNYRLIELEEIWSELQITSHFHLIHHFSSQKFHGKRESLKHFIRWCNSREIRHENAQTLTRALEVARRVKAGQSLAEAVRDAWTVYPIVSR